MAAVGTEPGSAGVVETKVIKPSFWNALPHFLPVTIFPLIIVAALLGGWWILAPFIFFGLAGPLDLVFGMDGRNMNPAKTPERRLFWYNLPAWLWALLWPVTFVFTAWQIFVAGHLSDWEGALMVFVLAMEAQAIFIVGHELIHRRAPWERRVGEFLLASASYPQYATEHVYIHHAFVGTPKDAGSAPKGVSLWRYFPREVVSNLVGSWRVAHERLARKGLPVWHRSNPFWRYGLAMVFWYGVVLWLAGPWAIPVYMALCLGVVFSMKVSNYIQHYGLRRVRVSGGKFEKILPRHSWSVDYRFSNWMFFNMQRHADHHAVWGRRYPLLQFRGPDESPQLPGSYGKMFGLAVRPKRWFATMDPLVDEWRARFYPHIDDWSAYDSAVSEARPEFFDEIVEIYGAAPRLAQWIERQPDLLDELRAREFTDLDLPQGFGPDAAAETIARQGLTRLYWLHEFGVAEMREEISETPVQDLKDLVEFVRGWSNRKAFQIGMHTVRGNLTPAEAGGALASLAESAITAVLQGAVAERAERTGEALEGSIAALVAGDIASREVAPNTPIEIMFVHEGGSGSVHEALSKEFAAALRDLSEDSLLFAPGPLHEERQNVWSLEDLAQRYKEPGDDLARLARARCVFTTGDADLGARLADARRELAPPKDAADPADIEEAALHLQLSLAMDEAPKVASVFQRTGEEGLLDQRTADDLCQAAELGRNLKGIRRLVVEDGEVDDTVSAKVKSVIARACGMEGYDALEMREADLATREREAIASLAREADAKGSC